MRKIKLNLKKLFGLGTGTENKSLQRTNNRKLSHRGIKAAKAVLRIDLDVYFEAIDNLYHQENNPDGTFPLNMAENKLCWGMLKEKMETLLRENTIPDWVAGYTNPLGAIEVRTVVADFLSEFLCKCHIDPEQIGLSAGATSVIEMSSFLLGDSGDVAVFPSPSYPVYKQDIGNKAELQRYNLVTHHEIDDIREAPCLTITHLETALKDIQSQGKQFRVLVLTNPDNPTGGLFTRAQLEEITDWCLAKKIHLVVNEIYGLSIIDTKNPAIKDDFKEHYSFSSFAKIMQERQSDYLHWWYSFSKDFGVSGFRIGVVHSLNETLMKAYGNINLACMVSNFTQWLFQLLLEDNVFVKEYIETNQKRLTENYITAVQSFRKLNIPYTPSRGSLFIWVDMSEFLENQSQDAENKFWFEVYEKTKILLTPGEGFGHTKKGLFRVVFPFLIKEDLEVAMARLEAYILEKRNG